MQRSARIVITGYPHRIVQRGHNRQAVFIADEDCLFYIENLREWKEKLALQGHHITWLYEQAAF
jgi:putative transposase